MPSHGYGHDFSEFLFVSHMFHKLSDHTLLIHYELGD